MDGGDTTTGGRMKPQGGRCTIRVMIVDDSLVARTVLSRIVENEPDLEIVAKATTGEMALARLAETPADVILLDLEMPGMGGLGALPRILELASSAKVLVVSSLTERGAEATLSALAIGAADTLLKPRSGEFDEGYARTLVAKIRALAPRGTARALARPPHTAPATKPASAIRSEPQALAIGASTGGIHALCLLLGALPHSFALPILVVQHLPASFMTTLARQLATASGRPAAVAGADTPLEAGGILVAPGEGHMVVRRAGGRLVTGIAHHAVPSGCTPSVDPLFETLADATGGKAIGVILSGMGRDGAIGAERLVRAGGTLFAQDAATSAVWGMPRAVAEAGLATAVLPPDAIAQRLVALAAPAPDATERAQPRVRA
ncbi:Chemotaxis response regulator protein-glutamate methylesterase [Tsuneonella dongtanensis]|uniref:Protein-glutamate methylesterase/protein-glutamine glutaminase n=1 Tax=Tsuneonella dongtanensis TaxID=692370 RepID=A0A1B2ABD3_9SPHN|nr:chemotaxis-specific protein-glutamate methyltransferase CheB [Tsuneonella dongtanensis]ANY19469.1 Chemotaxis response regulator protein-glutamate methylesterase [Tsuneonella dongtanensis]